ncbi:hyaluronoglucosaminidase [Haloactinopolyspora alba]|uniref:Hyaluronoglucosaminidase n=1 Tax=Haloactinopolyspora alba TaxID=648780 RepID=A0A2P8DM02_9ACTN|nr:beta-N-acetylglucosaminidase domain-containing protein [Haloactinopolyspora alba]PSK98263.1 hyaluronoglucosaminidase [Haloactinopolyspora alba]
MLSDCLRRAGAATATVATATVVAVALTTSMAAAGPPLAGSGPPASPPGQPGQPGPPGPAGPPSSTPVVSPTPQSMERIGPDVVVPGRVEVVTGEHTDGPALDTLVDLLREHGAGRVDVVDEPHGRTPLTVHLGRAGRPDIDAALADTRAPDSAEGYALRVDRAGGRLGSVALGGSDAAGQYYAVQTLRQLFVTTDDGDHRLAGVAVSDHPSMPLRGTIEGFYGQPWSHQDRLDQLEFYGDVKANTYIYAPKDDPYHRERWREPYPPEKRAQLAELVDTATANHVRFTFALSPGNTICYSGADDRAALLEKFQSMYDIGVRAFSIPLDDIELQFGCAEDRERYGEATQATVGRAQAELLSYVQREFVATHDGARALQTVPTQYGDLKETPYKQAWREHLDQAVVVMWTGNAVVPRRITVEQAERISELYGREVFVWDNYPVNDYGNTRGRLLLAPYDNREPGLSDHLAGIVSNPMNQAAASKVAIFGFADFTWNDRGYDARSSWREAMRYLADDDPAATEALLVFGDLNHLAPSFGEPWQPQAPALAAEIDRFWQRWSDGDRADAVADLRAYAEKIEAAPATIRAGAVDPRFVAEAAPWLDATELWGRATLRMLDALQARLDGAAGDAVRLKAESDALAEDAAAVVVDPPVNRWGRAPVRIADGVLDTFLVELGLRVEFWDVVGDARNLAPAGTASASSVEQDLDRLAARHVNDDDPNTRWASGYDDDSWVQVELPSPSDVVAVTVSWESACADSYRIETSADGKTFTTAAEVTDSTCGLDVIRLDTDEPVRYVRMQGVQRATDWGYSIWEMGIYGTPAE